MEHHKLGIGLCRDGTVGRAAGDMNIITIFTTSTSHSCFHRLKMRFTLWLQNLLRSQPKKSTPPAWAFCFELFFFEQRSWGIDQVSKAREANQRAKAVEANGVPMCLISIFPLRKQWQLKVTKVINGNNIVIIHNLLLVFFFWWPCREEPSWQPASWSSKADDARISRSDVPRETSQTSPVVPGEEHRFGRLKSCQLIGGGRRCGFSAKVLNCISRVWKSLLKSRFTSAAPEMRMNSSLVGLQATAYAQNSRPDLLGLVTMKWWRWAANERTKAKRISCFNSHLDTTTLTFLICNVFLDFSSLRPWDDLD